MGEEVGRTRARTGQRIRVPPRKTTQSRQHKRKCLTNSELQRLPLTSPPYFTTAPDAPPCPSSTKDNHIISPTRLTNTSKGVIGAVTKTGSACTRKQTVPTPTLTATTATQGTALSPNTITVTMASWSGMTFAHTKGTTAEESSQGNMPRKWQ
jgi:hypothetical protein